MIAGINEARKLAERVHANQRDKSGKPYLNHIQEVVAGVDTEVEKTIAWLHDTVEDTEISPQVLYCMGFNEDVICAVEALTKIRNEPVEAYLARILRTPYAANVKIADLKHNMQKDRLPVWTEKDEKRYQKYTYELEVLKRGHL